VADYGFVPPELNNPDPGAILFVGRDPGRWEVQKGRPFIGRAGRVFDECLDMAGLQRSEVNIANVVGWRPRNNMFFLHSWEKIEEGQRELWSLIGELNPSVIVTMGNEAAHTLIADWPDNGSIKRAKGIQDRRGFVWEITATGGNIPILATVHPSFVDRTWVPWAALLAHDMERAAELHEKGLTRPEREVHIVTSIASAREALSAIRAAPLVGCDIENLHDAQTLACVGFAVTPSLSYVFPATEEWMPLIADLLSDPSIPYAFSNGQYDRYFLRTRNEIEIVSHTEDTQVAWHCCYPELAGKSEQKKGKPSRKSLAFCASMFVWDAWWKDYDFETEEERYILNGKDCCVSLDLILNHLGPLIEELGVEEIYRHEMGLIPLCIDGQQRGIMIDEPERVERIEKLSGYWDELQQKVEAVVMPELEAAHEVGDNGMLEDAWHLLEQKWTCPCCRNGSAKMAHCTSCAEIIGTGANGSIKKGDLVEHLITSPFRQMHREELNARKKDALLAMLSPCEVCSGDGQRLSLAFNLNSDDQVKALVYGVWRLPRKYQDKKLSVAEDKLKSLQAFCTSKAVHAKDDEAQTKWNTRSVVIRWLIEARRITTMKGIYKGLAPAEDGRIRTVMNPTGTETGRFSHGTSFLEPSRNLGNMPKKTAGLHPLFNVRAVMVPSNVSALLMEADYSQAEARDAAWRAGDPLAIQQYEEGVDRYRFFAGHFYGLELEEVSKTQRHVGKTGVLALQYGVEWKTFMEHVNEDEELTGASITAARAKEAVGLFHELYPHYRPWHQKVWQEAKRNGGWLRNVYGRRRDFFGRRSTPRDEAAVLREMVAFLPQSDIADHLNSRAAIVHQQLDPEQFLFLLQIHDAILGEVNVARYMQVGRRVKAILEEPITLGGKDLLIPVEVSVSRKSWAEMKELEL